MTDTTASGSTVEISDDSLAECFESAEFWSGKLLRRGARIEGRATACGFTAAALSTLAGLSVWTVLADRPDWWAQLLVSVVAFLAAMSASAPKLLGYDTAGPMLQRLNTEYGEHAGRLRDARVALESASGDPGRRATALEVAGVVRDAFEDTKKEKDRLAKFIGDLQEARDIEKKQLEQERRDQRRQPPPSPQSTPTPSEPSGL